MIKILKFFINRSFWISIVILCSIFILFYPKKFISVDEYEYIRNANLIFRGDLRQECNSEITTQFKVQNQGEEYCVSKYNIGTSVFFMPVVLINYNLAFFITFFVFLSSIYIFKKLLQKYKISLGFLYLFAFYPTFIYYSRTLFSEIFSMFLLLLLFYLCTHYFSKEKIKIHGKKKLLLGITIGSVAGMAVLVRYTNVIFISILLLVYLWQDVSKKLLINKEGLYSKVTHVCKFSIKKLSIILIGAIPFIIIFFLINNYLYGSIIRSGYYFSQEQNINKIDLIPQLLPRYILIFLLLYPGMLIIAFLKKQKYKLGFLLAFCVMLIFYSTFPTTFFEGRILDLIFGSRFFVPFLGILLFFYVYSLDLLIKKKDMLVKIIRVLIAFCIGILIITSIFLSLYHNSYLKDTQVTYLIDF